MGDLRNKKPGPTIHFDSASMTKLLYEKGANLEKLSKELGYENENHIKNKIKKGELNVHDFHTIIGRYWILPWDVFAEGYSNPKTTKNKQSNQMELKFDGQSHDDMSYERRKEILMSLIECQIKENEITHYFFEIEDEILDSFFVKFHDTHFTEIRRAIAQVHGEDWKYSWDIIGSHTEKAIEKLLLSWNIDCGYWSFDFVCDTLESDADGKSTEEKAEILLNGYKKKEDK